MMILLIKDLKVLINKKYLSFQKLLLKKVIEAGEIRFDVGQRNKNKKKAVKILNRLRKTGYIDFEIYFNDLGYVVKNI